jgi:hypothetical protein
LKIQTADTLSLEVFESDGDSQKMKFFKRIVLPETRDAYFNFHGNATNLALTDVDGDGSMEIVAPTFDENLIPRLNVYKYDSERQDFIRLGPENLNL